MSHRYARRVVFCAVLASAGCENSTPTWPSSGSSFGSGSGGASSSGGSFAGKAGSGFAGSFGAGPGVGTPSACSPQGGPVDVGRIGGPGRDGASHHFTLPFTTATAPRLAIDAAGNLVTSMHFWSLELGEEHHESFDDGDVVVAKFDADGTPLWSRASAGTGMNEIRGLATDAQGNVFLAGTFGDSLSFGGPELVATIGASGSFRDIFLVKLTSEGEHVFSLRFGDASEQAATAVAVDEAGNVTLAGDFAGVLDFGGEQLVSQRGAFGSDIFVARFDGEGQHLSSVALGDQSDERVAGLVLDQAGNATLYGTRGADNGYGFAASGLFVQQLDAADELAHAVEFSAAGADAGGIALLADGGVVITGSAPNGIELEAGDTDTLGAFVAKLDASGAPVWSRSFGSGARVPAVDAVPDGILLSGGFTAIDLGGGSLPSAGQLDVFVAKLDTAGDHVWSLRGGSCAWDEGLAVRAGAGGNVYVMGTFVDALDFGSDAVRGGAQTAFLARFAP